LNIEGGGWKPDGWTGNAKNGCNYGRPYIYINIMKIIDQTLSFLKPKKALTLEVTESEME